jgi:periplasmic divalent cation tolerance protein
MPDRLLVVTTLPDGAAGEKLAKRLIDHAFAACVNISAPVTSIYRWDGKLESGREVVLTIKTTAARYAEVEQAIRTDHPYELPEVIAVPITAGSDEYLAWIDACTKS